MPSASAATTAILSARTAVTGAQDQNILTKNPQGGTHSAPQAESSQFGTLSHPPLVPQTGASPVEATSSFPQIGVSPVGALPLITQAQV
jgi:hypothetical protein